MAGKQQVVATGFIIFRRLQSEIQYLLLQTSYGEHHWTPPKGHVDPGESEIETALRETEEEAGLTKDHFTILDGFKKTLHYPVRGKDKRVVYWLSEVTDPHVPVILSHEHLAFKWLSLPQAVEYARFPDFQQTLREANDFIESLPQSK